MLSPPPLTPTLLLATLFTGFDNCRIAEAKYRIPGFLNLSRPQPLHISKSVKVKMQKSKIIQAVSTHQLHQSFIGLQYNNPNSHKGITVPAP